MSQANVPATPSPFDAVLAKLDALIAAPVLGVVEMTSEQLQAHVTSEIAKSVEEAAAGKAEQAKARLEHLKAQTALAKGVFDEGAKLASITMFKDPWQTLPGESSSKTVDPTQPAIASPDSNVHYTQDVVFTTHKGAMTMSPLMKALYVLSKAKAESPAMKSVIAKSEGAQIIAKASEARNILATIATLFGIATDSPDDVLEYDFKWSISDTISALQAAAKLEGVMAQMSSLMGGAEPAAKSAGTPAPATPPPPPHAREEAWPTDMSAPVNKTGEAPAWGYDSGPVPTT